MQKNCKPGIYPEGENCLPSSTPQAEISVYKAIKYAIEVINQDIYGWHSVRLKSKTREESEADFIVAFPPNRLFIFEVKGGIVTKEKGKWFQNSKPLDKAPLDQAKKCRRILLSIFQEHNIKPPSIGEGLILPDTPFSQQPTQGDLKEAVIGKMEIPYLEKILIPFIENNIPHEYKRRTPGEGWLNLIHDLWCESWPFPTNLAFITRETLQKRIKLDQNQFKIIEAAYSNDFVLIRGNSGTGKTLLAKILAEKEADTGRKVLLLTFTEPLGKYLENQISHPNITVSPIGKLALSKLRESGFNKPEEYSPEFWNEATKKAAKNKSIWKKFCFDTIIIDEVQDFGKYEWKIIEKCSKKKKRIWAFKDENQLFWDKKHIPRKYKKKFFILYLSNNYRCPSEIQILANLYTTTTPIQNNLLEENFKIIKDGLEKNSIRVVVTQKELIHEEVGKTINDLIHEGFKPSEIAIISLRGRMFRENIMHRETIGGHRIFDASDERNKNNIIADTFLRFKGLERLAIIITDIRFASKNYRTRMYIALSRAIGIIRIVISREELEKDWILKKIWEEQLKLGN